MSNLAICTIISKNYLPYARVVAESFLQHNKGEVYVLLVDKVDGYFNPSEEKFTLIELNELKDNIPDFGKFCFKYNILELNTAVKPYFLDFLFKKFLPKKLAYFDPDILITAGLEQISSILDKYSFVLTPHLTAPIEDGFKPGELDILHAGAYNLGFIAFSHNEKVDSFLSWWQRRLQNQCVVSFQKALFVDQKWVELLPGFFDDVFILREPGYNVAYWNYHCRDVRKDGDKVLVNGKPSYFFHFSGFDPENITLISKYQNRFTMDMLPGMKYLFSVYSERVLSKGWTDVKKWPYAYGKFDNGVKIPSFARRLYLDMGEKAKRFGNPFEAGRKESYFNWLNEPVRKGERAVTRLLYSIYQGRTDIQRAFPDIFGRNRESFLAWALTICKKDYGLDDCFLLGASESGKGLRFKTEFYSNMFLRNSADYAYKSLMPVFRRNKAVWNLLEKVNDYLPSSASIKPSTDLAMSFDETGGTESFGINIAGYITSESGIGEAVRADIRAVAEAGVPHSLINLRSPSRQGDRTYEIFSENNPYFFNLVHVNADQVPAFFRQKGEEYFRGKYNIGFWYWELDRFPDEWLDRFQYFNEIWVASSFCQDAIAKVSPVPVVKVPPSVVVDRFKQGSRASFGLKEDEFIFLSIFDFLSFFERKNPLATLLAFKKAFGTDDKACLVLKCSNSDKNPSARDKIFEAAKKLNVKIIDDYLDKDDVHTLMSLSDCYISLHRSEGFGLPLAESMYLGKPVIATGYSSNTDFMNLNNSFPVKYRLKEIEEDIGPYKKGNIWAEPDVEHAAELMRLVYENRELAMKTGKTAQEDIKRLLSPEATGKIIAARLESIKKLRNDS